jgi:hypothetical protein
MPLTRHLYELDEVVSALQLCLRNWYGRAVFWTWELIMSGEEELALTTIRDMWLRTGGGYDPTIVSITPKTGEDWISLVLRTIEAGRAARSTNAETMLAKTAAKTERGRTAPPPQTARAAARRTTRSAAFVASLDSAEEIRPSDAVQWWISLDSACRQGAIQDAVWLLQVAQQPISADGIWSALQIACRGGPVTADAVRLLQSASTPHPTSQILHQIAAALLLCCATTTRETMLSPPAPSGVGHYVRDWTSWNAVIGRRAARIHAIPADALHQGTTRGSLEFRFTNVPDLREPLTLLTTSCRWWRETIKNAGAVEDSENDCLVFSDDDVYEEFMDTYFPDDIPDEWSAPEQQKSHGRGSLEKAPKAPAPISIREEVLEHRDWIQGIAVSKGRRRRPPAFGASLRRSQ